MTSEWKWTAELIIPFALPALAIAGIGWCLWRERQLNEAFDGWDRRLADTNDDVAVLVEADRLMLIDEQRAKEDDEVAYLDELWQRPAYPKAA